MTGTAFGHPLDTLFDGATSIISGAPRKRPLTSASIDVAIADGLARVMVERSLANSEAVPIEAIMTFPVGFDAVVTGLVAKVDGRVLSARTQSKAAARESYEDAIDRGKLAVVHEEVLRGVHMLSVANLAPGQSVQVVLEQVLPVTMLKGAALLRLPQTVGQLYGTSPLQPADDLMHSADALKSARLTVKADCPVDLRGFGPIAQAQTVTVPLWSAIELTLREPQFGTITGTAADGRKVSLTLRPFAGDSSGLDLAILFDRSGSTSTDIGLRGETIWSSMRQGLQESLARLQDNDRIVLWQFDDKCEVLGAATGPGAARLTTKIKKPGGGTRLGQAVTTVVDFGARDILVMTDGQTWAGEIDAIAGIGCRISAILVGPGSLDANIGHLVAMTGGQLFYAPGEDVGAALVPALMAARSQAGSASVRNGRTGIETLTCVRGGVEMSVTWTDGDSKHGADTVGSFAAALALPHIPTDRAREMSIAHGLCSHLTSLVLVDEAGESLMLLPEQRKIGLAEAVPSFRESAPRLRASGAGYASFNEDASFGRLEQLDKPSDAEMLHILAQRIDWDSSANRFLQGDFRDLSPEERQLLRRLFYRTAVVDFAARRGLGIDLVAIALAAFEVAPANTAAARFIKRVLGPDAEAVHDDLWRKIGKSRRLLDWIPF